jgi:hypothetical protein
MLTPTQTQETLARHFDRKADACEKSGDYGGKQLAQWWRFVAARVREVPAEALVSEDDAKGA